VTPEPRRSYYSTLACSTMPRVTDRQILDEQLKEVGPLLLRPHLMP
jgi:hypothetical protein